MKQDKFLLGILIGIGALIVLALTLFFLRQSPQEYLPEDDPAGVVHNYALAAINKDYQKAYGYLADLENKPTYEDFRKSFLTNMITPDNVSLDVGETTITGANEAIVSLTTYYSYGDPFSSRIGSSDNAILVKQNGAWKLTSMPYQLWDWNWYQSQ
ncbi:MAG: hypothetical protein LC099_09395 [Anaerolineales bacterium]|nr:hypothetical protein [Anaerolineales bacterium]